MRILIKNGVQKLQYRNAAVTKVFNPKFDRESDNPNTDAVYIDKYKWGKWKDVPVVEEFIKGESYA